MNIVINAVLAYENPRGVGRYINNLIPELAKIDKINNYYIYYGNWMKKYNFLQVSQENFKFIELNIKNKQIERNLYLSMILPCIARKLKPDIYFLIDTQATFIKPCKIISVIHDLAEFQMPDKYSAKQAMIRKIIVKLQVKLSDAIITVSNYSKVDICNRFNVENKPVKVIYNSLVSFPSNVKLEKPQKYFLFVSEIEKAKNLSGLIEAFNKLPQVYKDTYKIKVVGKKGNDYNNIVELVRKFNLDKSIEFYGYVSDLELKELYSHAYAFIFPSLFEGFGLPVLEAMGSGVPVICSNAASIPEVGGDAVLTFDPIDSSELCENMKVIIEDESKRNYMIKKGLKRSELFSGKKCAIETLDMFKKVGE